MPGINSLAYLYTMETLLISGGSRGIGAAVAKLAIGKYNIAILYKNSKDKAEALCNELSTNGVIEVFYCDVSSEDSVKEAVSKVLKRFGKIDKLCCSAGIAQSKMFIDLTEKDWHNMFATNVDGVYYLTKQVCEGMLQRKSGSIVYVSSIWGEEGASMESAYSASKAAIIGLGKSLSKEFAPNGVRVNVVTPGAIDTDMMKGYTKEDLKEIEESIPLGRLGEAKEVAESILFLLESSYITGAVLPVNGGGIF